MGIPSSTVLIFPLAIAAIVEYVDSPIMGFMGFPSNKHRSKRFWESVRRCDVRFCGRLIIAQHCLIGFLPSGKFQLGGQKRKKQSKEAIRRRSYGGKQGRTMVRARMWELMLRKMLRNK